MRSVPTWLRIWLLIQLAGFVVGSLLVRHAGSWVRIVFWAALAALLGWAMWKHAKGAWVVALFLAGWSLIGGLGVIVVVTEGFHRDFAWFLWGFLLAVAELATLLSRSARAWVNEPTERKWSYVPKQQDG